MGRLERATQAALAALEVMDRAGAQHDARLARVAENYFAHADRAIAQQAQLSVIEESEGGPLVAALLGDFFKADPT